MTQFKHDNVTPYKSEVGKKNQVKSMFDSIARSYDFLNHFLSLGSDILWRKIALNKIAGFNHNQILDVATGTGDLALEACKKFSPDHIFALDIAVNMLEIGKIKAKKAGKDKIIDYYKHKLPWLLFSLMPVFAFVLYLFYIRRKIFFVDHLIFAFHLHAATFVIITIQDLITWLTPLNADILSYYIPIYYFISLKKVYGQSIPKTIFKGIGIGFFYLIVGFLVLLLVAGLMFLMI